MYYWASSLTSIRMHNVCRIQVWILPPPQAATTRSHYKEDKCDLWAHWCGYWNCRHSNMLSCGRLVALLVPFWLFFLLDPTIVPRVGLWRACLFISWSVSSRAACCSVFLPRPRRGTKGVQIKIPFAVDWELARILSLKSATPQNIALHVPPTTRNSVKFVPSWYVQLHFLQILF